LLKKHNGENTGALPAPSTTNQPNQQWFDISWRSNEMNSKTDQPAKAMKLSEVAKSLSIGRNTLFKKLREQNVLNSNNVPRDRYIQRGLFTVNHRRYEDQAKQEFRDYYVTLVTPEGQLFISQTVGS
jgi:hypothetical protein